MSERQKEVIKKLGMFVLALSFVFGLYLGLFMIGLEIVQRWGY